MTILKTAEDLGVTERQRVNLARLAVGVKRYWGQPKRDRQLRRLDMQQWAQDEDGTVPDMHVCATAACLAGHAPHIGLGGPSTGDGWGEFVYDTFGADLDSGIPGRGIPGCGDTLFDLLFDPDLDGGVCEAVKRVAHVLQMGVDRAFVGIDLSDFYPDWEAIEALAGPTEKWLRLRPEHPNAYPKGSGDIMVWEPALYRYVRGASWDEEKRQITYHHGYFPPHPKGKLIAAWVKRRWRKHRRYRLLGCAGAVPYVVSFHDGRSMNYGGSEFFACRAFDTKKARDGFVLELEKQGYKFTK